MCVCFLSAKAAKKKSGLTFDDEDDLMDALGFDSDKNQPQKKETTLLFNGKRSFLLLGFEDAAKNKDKRGQLGLFS